MKIRNGFVSNSSSASFIITWKSPLDYEAESGPGISDIPDISFNQEQAKKLAVARVLDIEYDFDRATGKMKWELPEEIVECENGYKYNKNRVSNIENKDIFEKILKNTEFIEDGIKLKTEFWTSMLNTTLDFGTECASFYFALQYPTEDYKEKYLISAEIERD